MTIWVTGSQGMLGTDVCNTLRAAQHDVIATDRDLDITDARAVDAYLASNPAVGWVINCAAWTAVDAAEDDESGAFGINATGPRVLAVACRNAAARLLHISTDYVFDGRSTIPYKPTDPTNPTGAYGRTKLEGERAVLASGDTAIVLRTAWLYGPEGNNFVSTMIRLMNERDELSVVDDQRGTPTYTRDLAAAIQTIVSRTSSPGGTFHFTGTGHTTWYRFAREIYDRAQRHALITGSCEIKPTTTAAYGAKAPRPAYSVLDCTESERMFGIRLRDWREALEQYLQELKT